VGIIQEMATGFPGYNGMVPRENGFLSEMLLQQGYATFAVGKWHLTQAGESASGASKARWPHSRGFERYYGFLGGETNQWRPPLSGGLHRSAAHRGNYHLNADLLIEFLTDLHRRRTNRSSCATAWAPGMRRTGRARWSQASRPIRQGWDRWREVFARQVAWASCRQERSSRRGRRG
jgi:arylsulfatase